MDGVDETDLTEFTRHRMNLRQKAGDMSVDKKLLGEIKTLTSQQCSEQESCKLGVGDKVEILPEAPPGELKKKRFWKQGIIRGGKGMQICIVEFGNGR